MLRPSLIAGLGVAAVCGSVATGVIISGGAHAATRVPVAGLPGFGQVVVDKAANRVFVSEGTNASNSNSTTPPGGIVVADLSGNHLTTIDIGTGAQGLTLAPDGMLYAALSTAGKVAQIDPTTYSETDYPLPAGDSPEHVAAQSGKVWVSYNAGTAAEVGDITPGSTSSFEGDSVFTQSINFWSSPPLLAADPSDGGTIVAVSPDQEPLTLASFDVSGATPVVKAENNFFSTSCPFVATDVAVLPGGEQFTMACGTASTTSDPVFSTTDLSAASVSYPTSGGSRAIAVAPDGTVATGGPASGSTATEPPDINIFSPGGTTPVQSYTEGQLNGWNVAPGGLAWGGTTALAAVMVAGSNPSDPITYELRVITYPLLVQSQLTINGLRSSPLGTAINVPGTLTINGAPAAGQTVTISRSYAGGAPVQVGQAVTDSYGDFLLSDTPPTQGEYSYTASFAGDSATAPDTVTSTVTVLKPAQVALRLPQTLTVNQAFQVTGVLTINGAPAAGQTVTITRSSAGATPPPTATPTPTTSTTATATSTATATATHLAAPTPTASPTATASPSLTAVPTVTMCVPLVNCGTTTVTVGDAVTDSDGVFTIADTPPAPGTYTYTASFAGDSATAPATATGTVVAYPDQIVLQMPPTALPNQTFDASGWLTFASGASANGKTVTITRTNPDGTTTTITATTGTKGVFSFRDNPPADGTYTYTASYADSTGTVTAKTSATVAVARES